jgi:transcriptional regulator with XRE-family HTH domain
MLDVLKIRKTREAKGLSQANVAINVGASESLIQQIEAGTRIPNANMLKLIADYLGVTTDSFYMEAN